MLAEDAVDERPICVRVGTVPTLRGLELQKILSKGGMSSAATTPKDGKKSPDAPEPTKSVKEVGTAVVGAKKLGMAAAAIASAKK